jgi:MFS family permease
MPDTAPPPSRGQVLLALVIGQICLHSCMAGVRMAAPLQLLRQGEATWAVGLLVGLFAVAPIALALRAGRLADRHGYHRPIRIAVGFTVVGAGCALLSTWLPADWRISHFALMASGAVLVGAGANVGLITIQRSAGRTAADPTELKQVFAWLGLAPALANVVGPVLAGTLIDLGGFRAAYIAMLLLPLVTLYWARGVPADPRPGARDRSRKSSWDLLRTPGLMRLLLVNWLLSSSWDVHALLVPVLGHERGFSASAIGLVLGAFALAVAGVRLVIPLLAHRLREGQVLAVSMWWTAGVFALYPLAHSAWLMGTFAVMLGLSLGAVQPMIMSTLHQITPSNRHGEAIALRSMTINISSALMPLVFGALGAALGASALFWMMGAAVGTGSVPARRINAPPL